MLNSLDRLKLTVVQWTIARIKVHSTMRSCVQVLVFYILTSGDINLLVEYLDEFQD